MAQRDKVKELVGRGLNSYHTKSLQQMDRIEKKNREQNHKISILSNELDNDYLTKTEEGSVVSLEHSKEGMVYLDELQGNTLVNYCTDGSKELTLNGDIDVEGTFVTTTEGVDNGKVDVMCEGNTLVNLKINTGSKCSISWANSNEIDYFTLTENSYLHLKGKIANTARELGLNWCYGILGSINLDMLKPNTNYTLILDNKYDAFGGVHLQQGNATNNYIKQCRKIDKNTYILTTKDSFDGLLTNGIILYGSLSWDYKGEIDFKTIAFLEGDWSNREVPTEFFEGMKSVGQDDINGHKIEISSQNKNLLLPTARDKKIPIFLKKGTTLTLSTKDNAISNGGNIMMYDVNGEVVWFAIDTGRTSVTRTLPRDIYYMKDALSYNVNYELKYQLEISNTKTSYVEPKQNKKEILLNEPLRRVPNEVKDKIVKIGNKWFVNRNCDEVVVNGVKGSFTIARETDDYILFYIQGIVDNSIALGEGGKGTTSICDIFGWGSYGSDGLEYHTVSPYSAKLVAFNIKKSRLNEVTVDGIKKWLQSNPVKVVYQLKTPIYEPLEVEPTLNTYNDVTHISNNSIIPCNMKIQNSGYNAIIKPSTLYTVALDTNKSGTIGMNLGGAKGTTTNNILTLTTPATLTDDSLRLYGKGIKGSKVRLLEGDKTNWIPSFFEGMKSSFEDKVQEDGTYKMEILSNNENLFSVDDTKLLDKSSAHDIITNSTGYKLISKTDHRGWVYSTFKLPNILKPNTKYTFSCNITKSNSDSKVALRLYRFSDSKDLGLLLKTGSVTFTTPSTNVESIRLLTYTSIDDVPINQDDYVIFENIQISEITSDYTTKEYNKIQFSSIEPLRGLDNNVKDRFIFIDGKLKIKRECGKIVFNGIENWAIYPRSSTVTFNNTIAFQSGFLIGNTHNMDNINLRNNLVPNQGVYTRDIEGIFEKNSFRISVNKNRLKTLDVNGWKEFLSNNNLTIIYPLAEPTYEEIPFELQKIILEGYENGTLFFDTNIPPTSTVTYAGETPIVKSVKLNKTEVSSNTYDINDNIIPYLMDMDYRVVCLQLQSEEFNGGVAMARLFGGAYEMLKRDIQSKRYSVDEYRYRLDAYLSANKITEEEYNKLGDMLNE